MALLINNGTALNEIYEPIVPSTRNVQISCSVGGQITPNCQINIEYEDGTTEQSTTNQEGIALFTEQPFKQFRVKAHYNGDLVSVLQCFDVTTRNTLSLHLVECPKYQNPLISERPTADPTIWDGGNGYYYLWYTENVNSNAIIPLYRSKDLITWQTAGSILSQGARDEIQRLGDALESVTHNCWAPEIIKIGNKWNLYLSLNKYYMMVFTSTSPTGNFSFEKVLIDENTKVGNNQIGLSGNIDPCVRKDEDGKLWMFWGSMNGIWRVELSSDGLNLADNATRTHVAGSNWNDTGSRNNIFEGAYLYKRKNWWYLFVSSGNYASNYRLRVGRSATLSGDFKDINDISLTRAQNASSDGNGILTVGGVTNFAPILLEGKYQSQAFYAPGHNGPIFEDVDGRTFMFFHAKLTSEGDAQNNGYRRLCINEILWDSDDWPYFESKNAAGRGIVTPSGCGPRLSNNS